MGENKLLLRKLTGKVLGLRKKKGGERKMSIKASNRNFELYRIMQAFACLSMGRTCYACVLFKNKCLQILKLGHWKKTASLPFLFILFLLLFCSLIFLHI